MKAGIRSSLTYRNPTRRPLRRSVFTFSIQRLKYFRGLLVSLFEVLDRNAMKWLFLLKKAQQHIKNSFVGRGRAVLSTGEDNRHVNFS